jgi:predicted GTPase
MSEVGVPPAYGRNASRLSRVGDMRARLLEFFYNDEEYQQLMQWSRQHAVLRMAEAGISSKLSVASSPLKLIEESCIEAAESLAQSSVVLCVYGGVNVGKSTFCNLLLGRPALHVTNVQCTAVATMVSSAPSLSSAKVIFDTCVDVQ